MSSLYLILISSLECRQSLKQLQISLTGLMKFIKISTMEQFSTVQEDFVKIESWLLLIIVYKTNESFITPRSFNYKQCKCLNKVIHQIDRKCTVVSYPSFNKFYGKIWVGFCLKKEKYFFVLVLFQSQQYKKTTRDFHNGPLCKRLAYP